MKTYKNFINEIYSLGEHPFDFGDPEKRKFHSDEMDHHHKKMKELLHTANENQLKNGKGVPPKNLWHPNAIRLVNRDMSEEEKKQFAHHGNEYDKHLGEIEKMNNPNPPKNTRPVGDQDRRSGL